MTSAKNLEEVRELNLSTVLELIHRLNVCSRAELAERTGLRQSTITNIVNVLIEAGLVAETGSIGGKKGRRSIGVTLSKDRYQVIGIRLARNNYSVERFYIDGSYDAVIRKDFESNESMKNILESIRTDTQELLATAKLKVVAIGVSVPGPFNLNDAKFINVTYMNGMEEINLQNYFKENFDEPVYIEHDANAGVLAEKWFGKNDMEKDTYIYIAAGFGVGAGIMINGQVFHGSKGIAGEIGHMSINFQGPRCTCGNAGCLEMYASAHAVSEFVKKEKKRSNQKSGILSDSYEDILEAYFKGDLLAENAIMTSADYLGIGIANIINLYNPNGIIIGDSLSRAGAAFLDRVKKKVSHLVPTDIFEMTHFYLSSFEQDAALVGAGALAIEKSFQFPKQLIDSVSKNF